MDLERAKGFINYEPSSEVDTTLTPWERFSSLRQRIIAMGESTHQVTTYDPSGEYKVIVWTDTVSHTEGRLKEIGAQWHLNGETYFAEKLQITEPHPLWGREPDGRDLMTLAQLEDSVSAAEEFKAAFEARMAASHNTQK